jgi:hypothetical protein
MQIIQNKLTPKSTWDKVTLEDYYKSWMLDMSIFNEKNIPLEIIAGITLNQAEIFKSKTI